MFGKLRSLIFKLDPELAHNLAIKALKYNYAPSNKIPKNNCIETEIFGKKISNPVGLAAGFDKDAEVYNSLFKLGFGFVDPADELQDKGVLQQDLVLYLHQLVEGGRSLLVAQQQIVEQVVVVAIDVRHELRQPADGLQLLAGELGDIGVVIIVLQLQALK